MEERIMGFIQEFKDFAMRGNVVDLAVGIIIGGAFGKVVTALVDGVLMPPIGLLIGGVNFDQLAFELRAATAESAAVSLNYGAFLQTIVDFVIIAFSIFVVIKALNSLKRKSEEAPKAPPVPSKEEVLLGEIRDLLKERG